MIDFENLAAAMGELDEDTVKELLEQVMAEGGADAGKAMEACQKGMDTVGKLFEEGEYFVGDLIYAGELMTDAVAILKDALVTGESSGTKTRMILCTVKDDLHDIGDIHAGFPEDGQQQHRAQGAVVVPVDGVAHVMHPAGDGGQFDLAGGVSQ